MNIMRKFDFLSIYTRTSVAMSYELKKLTPRISILFIAVDMKNHFGFLETIDISIE